MGDLYINRKALSDVVGASTPLYEGDEHPTVPADKRRDAFELHTINAGSINDPTRYDLQGRALYVLPSSTSGVKVALSFDRQARGALELGPGESLRVPRGFGRVWLTSAGGPGTINLLVVRAPLYEPQFQPPQSVTAGQWVSIEVMSPGNGTQLLTTGVLTAGVYAVRVQLAYQTAVAGTTFTLVHYDSLYTPLNEVRCNANGGPGSTIELDALQVSDSDQLTVEHYGGVRTDSVYVSLFYRKLA